jgi:hypothetical protein
MSIRVFKAPNRIILKGSEYKKIKAKQSGCHKHVMSVQLMWLKWELSPRILLNGAKRAKFSKSKFNTMNHRKKDGLETSRDDSHSTMMPPTKEAAFSRTSKIRAPRAKNGVGTTRKLLN